MLGCVINLFHPHIMVNQIDPFKDILYLYVILPLVIVGLNRPCIWDQGTQIWSPFLRQRAMNQAILIKSQGIQFSIASVHNGIIGIPRRPVPPAIKGSILIL
jgi:hypothetical protein